MNIEIDESEDPVEIAAQLFKGTYTSRKLWRSYLMVLYETYKSIDKANTLFIEAIYTTASEIKNDGIPDTLPARGRYPAVDHIHAKHFTNVIKRFIP